MIELLESGAWGISHGLLSLILLLPLWWFSPWRWPVVVVAVVTAGWWFHREHRARKTLDITQWYLDSQLDFLVPLAVSIFFLILRPRKRQLSSTP